MNESAAELFLSVCRKPTLANAIRLLGHRELAELTEWLRDAEGEIQGTVWSACTMEAAERWLAQHKNK